MPSMGKTLHLIAADGRKTGRERGRGGKEMVNLPKPQFPLLGNSETSSQPQSRFETEYLSVREAGLIASENL